MTDEERRALVQELLKKDLSELNALQVQLIQQLYAEQDLNSAYPATKEFLEARGFTNVRQLDEAGLKELEDHLQKTLADILKTSS